MKETLQNALDEMLTTGETIADDLITRIKAFGQIAVPRLIEIATSEELNHTESDDPRVYAPLHAVKILGELRAVESIEPLLPMLAWDDDDWLDNVFPEYFGHIGKPGIAPLERVLADATRTIHTQARASNSLV
ncbi:MAG: hypothetical protein HZC40_21055 [Chloroflexi bacterium]|nr:hypothetical protein [Chloroflexota bacterium]